MLLFFLTLFQDMTVSLSGVLFARVSMCVETLTNVVTSSSRSEALSSSSSRARPCSSSPCAFLYTAACWPATLTTYSPSERASRTGETIGREKFTLILSRYYVLLYPTPSGRKLIVVNLIITVPTAAFFVRIFPPGLALPHQVSVFECLFGSADQASQAWLSQLLAQQRPTYNLTSEVSVGELFLTVD